MKAKPDFWNILLLFLTNIYEGFPIKETFFQRYVYSKFIPAERQETWGKIIRRRDGTNHFYLCPGKVRVQFHNYDS